MKRAPRGLRSIKNRLALLFFAITFVALAVAYVYVAPTLSAGLRTQKLHALQIAAQAYSHRLQGALVAGADRRTLAGTVHHAAQLSNDRVTLLGIERAGGRARTVYIDDSSTESPGEHISGLSFAIGDRVVRERKLLTGTESSANGPIGEAAKPLFDRGRVVGVAVFSGTLSDVERSVAAIRERMLIAGALALALSLLAGYLLARAISLRVGRLEEAAWRVAQGDFGAHFAVDWKDELGQLARALDSMQRQLAELDSARERFIATASHELRTPIFSIGGFLELTPGRGARRGDPAPVPRPGAHAGRAPRTARHRPAGSLPPGVRCAGAAFRTRRPRRDRADGQRGVSPRAHAARLRAAPSRGSPSLSLRAATPNASRRSSAC